MVQDQAQLDIVSISRLAPGESPSPQPFERRSKSLAISCSSQLGTRTPPASCPASPRLSLTPSSAKPQQYSDSSPASPGTNAASFYALCPQTAHSLEASASDYTLTPTRKSTRPPTTPEDSSQSPGSSKTGLRTIGKGFQSHLENPDHERYVSRLHMLKSSNDDQFKYLLYLHVSSVCFPIMTLYFHYILQKDHFHSKRSFPFIYLAGWTWMKIMPTPGCHPQLFAQGSLNMASFPFKWETISPHTIHSHLGSKTIMIQLSGGSIITVEP